MKKTIIICLLLSIFTILGSAAVSACTDDDSDGYCIELTNPVGNEQLKTGDILTIQWTQKNIDLVVIGYKRCDSCLDWIKFTHPVDLQSTEETYNWKIPDEFVAGDISIQISGYRTGVGSETDVSSSFTVEKVTPQVSTSFDASFTEVYYFENPIRYIPFTTVYNVYNNGNKDLHTNKLIFTTTIGSKTKQLMFPQNYVIQPKSNYLFYVTMVFDEEVGTFDVTYKIDGVEGYDDVNPTDNVFVKTVTVSESTVEEPETDDETDEDRPDEGNTVDQPILGRISDNGDGVLHILHHKKLGETIYILGNNEYTVKLVDFYRDSETIVAQFDVNGRLLSCFLGNDCSLDGDTRLILTDADFEDADVGFSLFPSIGKATSLPANTNVFTSSIGEVSVRLIAVKNTGLDDHLSMFFIHPSIGGFIISNAQKVSDESYESTFSYLGSIYHVRVRYESKSAVFTLLEGSLPQPADDREDTEKPEIPSNSGDLTQDYEQRIRALEEKVEEQQSILESILSFLRRFFYGI
ncbi:MAG TPA: hypothetical protein VJB66_05350 [Candidatus Nanoarchaeia archaeon]|nr:hypothetical protein [Candidatus Nanoarchaeia archaeon]